MSKAETGSVLVENGDGTRTTIPVDTPEDVIAARGWTVIEDDLAVSRPRRTRTKADMKRLIAEGVVADPAVGVPDRVPTGNEYVIDVPPATVTGTVER